MLYSSNKIVCEVEKYDECKSGLKYKLTSVIEIKSQNTILKNEVIQTK